MDVLFERCCGLDIHKRTITACVLTPGERRKPRKEVRRFETTVAHLLALGDWMAEEGVTHVAMESTGVYWKPVYNLLEERFYPPAGQRAPHQGRAWPQDRRAGL